MTEMYEFLCKQELSDLGQYERHHTETLDEIATLQEQLTSIKGAKMDGMPVHGGTNSRENWLVNTLCRIDRLKAEAQYAESKAQLTRKALDTLDYDERRILEVLYVDKQKYGAERLCEELGYESRAIWRKRETALKDYDRARHGAHLEV